MGWGLPRSLLESGLRGETPMTSTGEEQVVINENLNKMCHGHYKQFIEFYRTTNVILGSSRTSPVVQVTTFFRIVRKTSVWKCLTCKQFLSSRTLSFMLDGSVFISHLITSIETDNFSLEVLPPLYNTPNDIVGQIWSQTLYLSPSLSMTYLFRITWTTVSPLCVLVTLSPLV